MNTEQIQASVCPQCGAPIEPGKTTCSFCSAELRVIPNFKDSDITAEKDMRRLLLEQNDARNFFVRLDAHINAEFGYNSGSLSLFDAKRGAILLYKERVGQWLLEQKSEIQAKIDSGKLDSSPLPKMQEQIKKDRLVFQDFLNKGWPKYLLDNIANFSPQNKNAAFDALSTFITSANKSVSGEIKKGLMTPADTLIATLFCTDAIHDVIKLVKENSTK